MLLTLLLLPYSAAAQIQERFPKPDFQTDYIRPDLATPWPRSTLLEYFDIFLLVFCLGLAAYLAHQLRSRGKIFLLMLFSLAYFGFYRQGCVCSIGALQNVAYALFNPDYAIPIAVIAFFVLPLFFTLFFGRIFCAAVCPLGALQDIVVLKPVRVPRLAAELLGLIPYLYLGTAVLLAATGAGFVICRYDPFVGFFRFGAGFNMVLFGISLLLLGTVVARPFCRFLCPYSVLLKWASRLSKKHVKITPDECNNCRLCEDSCPFGAIEKPQEATPETIHRSTAIRQLAVLIVLLPVLILGFGWAGSHLYAPLAGQHPTVSLAAEIALENSGQRTEMSEATQAFRAAGKPYAELFSEAGVIQKNMRSGGWLLGGFIGLILGLKLIGLSRRKIRNEYTIDKGTCLSCGRCFRYCPYEQVRLGIISPEEFAEIRAREIPIKQV